MLVVILAYDSAHVLSRGHSDSTEEVDGVIFAFDRDHPASIIAADAKLCSINVSTLDRGWR